jgi:SAM-dependent methyltransferase
MLIISPLIDSYYTFRLRSQDYRYSVYNAALKKDLRGSKTGRILLRNLAQTMNEHPAFHQEFSRLVGPENYQKSFWESDLGYLWYENNFNVSNKYFDFALEEIKKNDSRSLLDVGCGWGGFCNKAAALKTMERIKGIDISEDIILKAKEAASSPSIVFECEDALNENEHFDLITLFGSTDYIPSQVFEKMLEHLLVHASKQVIIVNSLRGIPFEKALALETAIEVKRYDDGYLQPISFFLKKLKLKYTFEFTVTKYGQDSQMAVIHMNKA